MNFLRKIFLSVAACASLFAQAATDFDTLFTVGSKPIFVSEFLYQYKKNNKFSKEEFLKIFKENKLKVAEASSLGLDSLPDFLQKFSAFRLPLAKPYLTDNQLRSSFLKQALSHLNHDLDVWQIMISLPKNPAPADTLSAYKKALQIRKRLLAGDDFSALAREFSDDPSAKKNDGHLGFITAMTTIFQFENAVYNLPLDSISQPIRTSLGYHIARVTDRRPAISELRVAQILKKTKSQSTENESLATKTAIDSLHARLLKGENFSSLARKFSDDKKSSFRGGELAWFGVGQMQKNFENAAFSLQEIGDFSAPFQTDLGWHIVKLLDKRSQNKNDKFADIQQLMLRDGREDLCKLSFRENLKKLYNFKLDEFAKHEMFSFFKISLKKDSAFFAKLDSLNTPIFSFAQKEFFAKNFVSFFQKLPVSELDNEHLEMFINAELLKFEDENLEKKYPEFANQISAFRDSLLLDELAFRTKKSFLPSSTAELEAFFKQNQANYQYSEPHFRGFVLECKDKKTAKNVKKIITSANPDSVLSYISSRINFAETPIVTATRGVWVKGENAIVDREIFGEKKLKFNKNDSLPEKFAIGNVLLIAEKLSDVKELVEADYQRFMEEKWLESLKEKFPIVENKKVKNEILNSK